MRKIYSISSPDMLLHIINRFQDIQDNRINISEEKALLQVSCYKLEKDKKVNAHVHLPQKRETIGTQESWVVLIGSVEAEYYDIDGKLIEKEILHPGDFSITFGGGHSLKSLEEGTIVYEHKNGPYYGPEKIKEVSLKDKMFRKLCLVCGSPNLLRIIDLGMHPFADTFILESRLSESEPVYPLLLDLCQNCSQVQAACITNPNERYSLYDYSYTSSNSKFAIDHWEKYAEEVTKKVNLEEGDFIVEIGSNDGFLSEQFLKKGYKVLGVDSSKYMADLAQKRGVETFVGLFDLEIAKRIKEKYGKAKLIIANNVFNHSDNPLYFAKGVVELLEDKGTFVFEQPSWFISIKSGKFDQIYHEHVSYFSAKSISELMKRVGMRVWDIQNVDYHGGSLRTFAKKEEDLYDISEEQIKMIKSEEEFELFNSKTYKKFMTSILRQKNELLSTIYKIKQKEIPIIAIGAAAKGNTLLNFYNLNKSVISYVTDASPHKQGKYTPLTRIPIVSDEIFKNYNEVYALILSWNISDSLKIILQQINPRIVFLSLPEMR